MKNSWTNVVNNLSEGIHKIKCQYGHNDKKCETWGSKYKYCDYFLEYKDFKDDLVEYKYLCHNKNYHSNFHAIHIIQFIIHIDFLTMIAVTLFHCFKTVFFLMDIWMIEKNSMKHYYVKKIVKVTWIWKILLMHLTRMQKVLADVFENFWKTYLEIYEFDPVGFLTVPGLAWQATLKIRKQS